MENIRFDEDDIPLINQNEDYDDYGRWNIVYGTWYRRGNIDAKAKTKTKAG